MQLDAEINRMGVSMQSIFPKIRYGMSDCNGFRGVDGSSIKTQGFRLAHRVGKANSLEERESAYSGLNGRRYYGHCDHHRVRLSLLRG